MHELDVIGVAYHAPVVWKVGRATSYWGETVRKKNVLTGKYDFTITISAITLDDSVSNECAKDTIIHELIHTVDGCWNHGEGFKRMAALVNDCYACYHISRAADNDDMGVSKEVMAKYATRPQHQYIVECARCHRRFTYSKRTRLVQQLVSHREAVKTMYNCPCGCDTFVLVR